MMHEHRILKSDPPNAIPIAAMKVEKMFSSYIISCDSWYEIRLGWTSKSIATQVALIEETYRYCHFSFEKNSLVVI